jgi:hypothetical protein
MTLQIKFLTTTLQYVYLKNIKKIEAFFAQLHTMTLQIFFLTTALKFINT